MPALSGPGINQQQAAAAVAGELGVTPPVRAAAEACFCCSAAQHAPRDQHLLLANLQSLLHCVNSTAAARGTRMR